MNILNRLPARQQAARPPEYWEYWHEPYPAAAVLDDLPMFPDNADAVRWIIVRYAAMRAIASLLSGAADAQDLRIERNAGLNHVHALPMLDREAWSLRRALESMADPAPRAMVEAMLTAGTGAEQRTHMHGAYAIYQLTFKCAKRNAWHAEAAVAARGAERIARVGGAVYSPRLWRRRARVMEKRSAVA